MTTRLVPEGDQTTQELARDLVSIARAEGLPLPKVDMSGGDIGFSVTKELLSSYRGKPAKGEEKTESSSVEKASGEDKPDKKSRKNRKGDK